MAHPGGRPSKYDPAYCERVVEFCREGYSLTSFAAEIGVDRATITRWMDEHEEFRVAAWRAKAVRTHWWETQAMDLAKNGGQGGRATMVVFGLKNHAPEDYSETKKVELTGKDGAPLTIADERVEDKKLLELALAAKSAAK